MRGLALSVFVACSSAPPPQQPVSSHEEPSPVARTTPAPKVAWQGRWDDTQLPRIARAGHLAVVAVHDGDGGRGFPNLRIEVRDRNDRTTQQLEVMTSNEYETLVADDRASAELHRRIRAANDELAKLHALHDLVAMEKLEVQKPTDDSLPHLAIGDGLDVDFTKNRLQIFHHNTDRPFHAVNAHAWMAPSGKRCAGCPPCENPPYLHGVFKAKGINAVVVEIAYRGTDTCWEPGNQLHFVAW